MSILSVQDISKRYKFREVVKGISLEITSGEVVGLLGPNGAGKTTAFYMIVGLIACDRGRILLDGQDLSNAAWIEAEDYRPDRHVFHYALPQPGRMEDLVTLATRAHERPMDRSRPLWEVHVIEGLQGLDDPRPGALDVAEVAERARHGHAPHVVHDEVRHLGAGGLRAPARSVVRSEPEVVDPGDRRVVQPPLQDVLTHEVGGRIEVLG